MAARAVRLQTVLPAEHRCRALDLVSAKRSWEEE